MKRVVVLAVLLAAASSGTLVAQPPAAPAPPPEETLALTGVTVIDGTGAAPRARQTIVIRGGRIAAIQPARAAIPDGATVHDFRGHFVIPGMFETHTHMTALDQQGGRERAELEMRRLLHAGVTTIRDAAGDARVAAALKRDLLLGRIVGPDIHFSALMAGPDFMALDPRVGRASIGYARGEAPWQPVVTAETDIPNTVSRAAATGATALKLYVGIDAPVMRALAEEAHRQGLMVWAHSAVFPDRPSEVVRAGADSMSHLCWLVWEDADLDPSQSVPYTHQRPPADPRPSVDDTLVQADSPEMTALFAEMARRGIILDATYSLYRPDAPRGCGLPLMTEVAKAAHRAGVRLSTGTDWFTPVDDRYPAVITEIERLVEGGILTPTEAITAATLHGALASGTADTHGTVTVGKVADLVVLRENPVENITAIRSVVAVFQRGKAVRGPE